MPRIKMNLGDIQVGGPTLPPGKYVAELMDCEEAESKAGNPMLIWTWEVIEGDEQGTQIKSFTSLQDHALFGLKGHLIGLGVEDPDSPDLDTDELIGTLVSLTVKSRKFKDRDSGEEREATSVDRVEEYVKPRAKKKRRKPAKKATKAKDAEAEDDDEDDDDDGDEQIPF